MGNWISCLIVVLSINTCAFACKGPLQPYSKASNCVDEEIDGLLRLSEECLFTGDFKAALAYVESAENLLPLTKDEYEHRKLRSLFDKAVIVTCIEGANDKSFHQFAKLNDALTAKSCDKGKSQPNLFDKNGHWPVLGDNPISIDECIDRVDTTERSLEIACACLPIDTQKRVAIEVAILAIARKARRCCTQNGFWKTCIQPVVDTWKRAELLGIPPDPYWD